MVTVTFQIKPYLAAYMYTRYKNHLDLPPDRSSSALSAIHLLDTHPIYHFLHQLSTPHPPNISWHETGNITFFKDGSFKVKVSPEELKKFLSNDFSGFVVK